MSDSKKPDHENGDDNIEHRTNDEANINEYVGNESIYDSDNLDDEAIVFSPDDIEVDHTHDSDYEEFDNSVSYESVSNSIPSDHEIKAPDDDLEFYEEYTQDIDPDEVDKELVRPSDHSDKSADLFSKLYGVGGVIRENAALRRNTKATTRHLWISLICNVTFAVVIFALIKAFSAYPKTKYIPNSDNSAICEVTPENNPNITDVAISDFAKDAVINLYTFDYVNYKDQINDNLARWFTPQGRIDTINAMEAAGILSYVSDKALTLRAGTTAAPRIERKGRLGDGKPYWVVRYPMVVDVYSGAPHPVDTQRYIVTVRIVADTASAQNPKGLGVASAALEPQG